jgi:hypothetical protein
MALGAALATPAAGAPKPCVPDGERYVIPGSPLRVCVEEAKRCVAVDLGTGTLSAADFVAKQVPIAPPQGTLEKRKGKLSACYANKCQPLGNRLRAAVAKAAKARRPKEPMVTTDLAAVVVETEDADPAVWSVAKDRPIIKYGDRGEQGIGEVIVIGAALYITWLPPELIIYTSAGKVISAESTYDNQVGMLDDHAWYLLGNPASEQLVVFDGGGKQKRTEIKLPRCP